MITERIQADIDANIAYHLDAGLPGDATTVMLLYLVINWLIVERLTLPDTISDAQARELVEQVVGRIVPEA